MITGAILGALLSGMHSPEVGAKIVGACVQPTFCDFHRPEDIAAVPGSKWLVVSQAGDEPVVLFDPESNTRKPLEVADFKNHRAALANCGDAPSAIEARGNSAAVVNGKRIFAIINQHGEPRIELFKIKGHKSPRLEWVGCVAIPAAYQLNDVALGPDGTIFASHMFDLPTGGQGFEKLRADFLAGNPTGFAVRWDQTNGWTKVDHTDVSFANGIAVSNDGQTLAIGGTYEQAVILLNLASGAATRVDLTLQPDNITPHGKRSFITVGHTGIPMTGIEPCRADPFLPCAFPFAVAAITPASQGYVVSRIFEQDTGSIPGASVAMPWQAGLMLGTSFGDRITYVQLGQANGAP